VARIPHPRSDRTHRRNPLHEAGTTDYEDTALLRRFISDRGKIRTCRVTGLTVQQQRGMARAIKSARTLALPYSSGKATR
jgi:small subunit ribosomal protein S18